MKNLKLYLNRISSFLLRFGTALVFFFFPVRKNCLFLEVSLSILILRSRSKDCTVIDMVKFFELVNNDYDDRVVGLPNYTLNFMWSEVMLSETYVFETGEHTLLDIMKDRQLLGLNIERLIDILLNNLPFIMRLKLGAISERKRIVLRKAIITCLNRKFEHQLA